MLFGIMSERGTIDAVFIFRRLQEEYHAKKKVVCFVDLEKVFDRVPRKALKWAMRKKGIPEVLARSMMSLLGGSELILSCQRSLRLKWGCTKDLCCHLYFFQWW